VIQQILNASGQRFLVPIILIVAGAALVKGLFSLLRSRSQDRRDFLELFRDWQDKDNLWITVAVRHLFGAHLPIALIRQLMSSPQPGRAMLEIANAWTFFDMDDETGEISWRRKFLSKTWARRAIIWGFPVFYAVSFMLAIWMGYLAVARSTTMLASVVLWVYASGLTLAAIFFLTYGDNLKDAERAARRWIGLM